jgi:hypothetical protein
MPDSSFQRAQQRYAQIRRLAYARARDQIIASGHIEAPLRLAECDAHALAVWKTAWTDPHPSGWGGWDWEPLLRRAWRNPAAFHLAIWSDRRLCGLAVGRVSDRDREGLRATLAIDYVEGAHDRDHPLRGKIVWLATTAAEAYGRALGAQWLRLMQPLPHILHLYTRLGFTIVNR